MHSQIDWLHHRLQSSMEEIQVGAVLDLLDPYPALYQRHQQPPCRGMGRQQPSTLQVLPACKLVVEPVQAGSKAADSCHLFENWACYWQSADCCRGISISN